MVAILAFISFILCVCSGLLFMASFERDELTGTEIACFVTLLFGLISGTLAILINAYENERRR